jgi:hypothetical protein
MTVCRIKKAVLARLNNQFLKKYMIINLDIYRKRVLFKTLIDFITIIKFGILQL